MRSKSTARIEAGNIKGYNYEIIKCWWSGSHRRRYDAAQ